MKKCIYLCAIMLIAVLFSSNKAIASTDTISYHYFYDSCTNGTLYATVSDSSGSSYMEISYGDGTSDTAIITYGYLFHPHSYGSAGPGTYTINMVWIKGGVRVDSVSFTITHSGCSYITGSLYHDVNSNCSFDAGDKYINRSVDVEVDSAGHPVDTIHAYRTIWYKVYTAGVVFTFKPISTPSGMTLACPSTGSISATSSLGFVVPAGALGYQCTSSSSAFDIATNMVTHTGRHSYVILATISNSSCIPKSGTLTINMDSHYPYSSSSPAGASVSGHTVSWSFSNLSIDSPMTFEVYGEQSPWVTVGTHISTTAYVDHVTGDGDITNDTVTNADTVTGSWDPNDKQVMPQGNISSGTTLNYTLSFENTGNAPAANIHIMDTLDANLNVKSLQVLSSSFPVTAIISKVVSTGKNVVRFDFVNINLLDSSHHGKCDGYVKFSIATKGGLSTGTTINNKAGIYFDDNEVVMTNTVTNTINPLAVASLNNISEVVIYPNPVHDNLVVKTGNGNYNQLTVINSIGQVMIQQSVQGNESQVNMHSLTPGIYFIMLKGAGGTKVEKVEKL